MTKQSHRPWAAPLLTLLLPLGGCMTTAGGPHAHQGGPEGPAMTEDKPGSKESPAPGTAPQQPGTPAAPGKPQVAVPPPPSVDEQLAFVRRASAPAAPFTEADRQFTQQLPPSPAPGSVAEAALALGLVRTVLNPLNAEVTTFQEQDLGKPAAAAPNAAAEAAKKGPPSLEQLCKEHGLNLPDALSENPLLGTAGAAKQVVQALAVGDNGAEFRTEVSSALRKSAGAWNEVSGTMPVGPQPGATPGQPAAPAPGPAAPAIAGAPGTVPGAPPAAAPGAPAAPVAGQLPAAPIPGAPTAPAVAVTPPPVEDTPAPSPAELSGGENVLAGAQALADRGDYSAAIKRLQSVPDGSPLKPQAQEKIKEFSNLGVQELRKKAALAFQTAMPVSDPRTRAGYLKQAKTYLEEAVTKYPDASQLTTVKDNLRVISRDLESLESEAGGKRQGE